MAVMIVWLIFTAFKKRILNSSDSFGSFSHPVTLYSSPVQRPKFVMQLVCSGNVGIDDYTRFNKEEVTSLGQSDFTKSGFCRTVHRYTVRSHFTSSFVMTLENLLFRMKSLLNMNISFLCLVYCIVLNWYPVF